MLFLVSIIRKRFNATMEKKVALVFLLMYCCVVLNAQPDRVCGRYGDGGECDWWGKRETPGERSTNIKDLLARKVRTSKNRAAREFLKRKSRLYKTLY